MDLFNREPLEGGITDLFAFPVAKDDKPVHPFQRKAEIPLADTLADIIREPLSAEQVKEIDAIVFILCVRRQLTQAGSLNLEPYKYRINIDVDSTVEIPGAGDLKSEKDAMTLSRSGKDGYGTDPVSNDQYQMGKVEAFARYGGRIPRPGEIREDIQIEFQLNNQAGLMDGYPVYSGTTAGWKERQQIRVETGIFDDPFIFPPFFGTNVVAMVIRIPISHFPSPQLNMLIWATSHRGDRQVDHVGRSLRTQNPRFEILNTLHPNQHAQAIADADHNPTLLRDIGLRINLPQLAAYRKWDRVPDVMCFSTKYPVGYPNGRLLTDDVAALLAQHGDTLLYELSYQHPRGSWPRRMKNDKSWDKSYAVDSGEFNPQFPYLLPPHPERPAPPPPRLSNASIMKLVGVALVALALLLIENLLFAKAYHKYKVRKRNL